MLDLGHVRDHVQYSVSDFNRVYASILLSVLDSFYVGRENGADPKQGVCTAQASLMSGIAPM